MTIREIQELIKFMDEKSDRTASADIVGFSEDDICRQFCHTARAANAAGMDLTESLVEWLRQGK